MIERTGYVSYANCGLPLLYRRNHSGKSQASRFRRGELPRALSISTCACIRSRRHRPRRENGVVKRLDDGATYEESYDYLFFPPRAKAVVPLPGIDDARIHTLRTVERHAVERVYRSGRKTNAVGDRRRVHRSKWPKNLKDPGGFSVTRASATRHLMSCPRSTTTWACDVHAYLRSCGIDLKLIRCRRLRKPG